MVGIYGKIFIVSKQHARVISNMPENTKGEEKKYSLKKKTGKQQRHWV
jgi:trace amine associated receptor